MLDTKQVQNMQSAFNPKYAGKIELLNQRNMGPNAYNPVRGCPIEHCFVKTQFYKSYGLII